MARSSQRSFILPGGLVHESKLKHIDGKSYNERQVIQKPIVSMAMAKPRCHVLIFSILDSFRIGNGVSLAAK